MWFKAGGGGKIWELDLGGARCREPGVNQGYFIVLKKEKFYIL